MTSTRRWLVVLAAVAGLVALPSIVQALPAPTAKISSTTLLQRIQASGEVAYSGYAESDGGLSLPVTSQFTALADLFGGHTQLRVWWRGARDWRVDSIGYTGETDLHMSDQGSWTWRYDSNSATFSAQTTPPAVRLPNDSDLLPTTLTRRLLSEVTPSEATALPAKRIAGENAPGLRIRPNQAASTIDHLDVWADNRTGLPLRVAVYGRSSSTPSLTSSFLDLTIGLPSASSTTFLVPAGASVTSDGAPDLATALDQLGTVQLPGKLAGIARNPDLPTFGTIGVYGQGVTEFAAIPLPRRVAGPLQDQLRKVGDTSVPGQLAVSSGPLNLLISALDSRAGPWLLIGTVTPQTLRTAATALPDRPRVPR